MVLELSMPVSFVVKESFVDNVLFSEPLHVIAIYIMQPVNNALLGAAQWQIIIITYERYLAVSRPLSFHYSRHRIKVRYICLMIAAVSLIWNVPTFMYKFTIGLCRLLGGTNSLFVRRVHSLH